MDRSLAALRCDQIVEGVDLGVEHVENGLMTNAVFAGGGGLARRHSFVEMNADTGWFQIWRGREFFD